MAYSLAEDRPRDRVAGWQGWLALFAFAAVVAIGLEAVSLDTAATSVLLDPNFAA